mmetsp:Transcript_10331/g.25237  ORF Transcript_10331/g.25237 Transcript_10331/m.25237 type:complete len:205 (-) Transcript_10331:85-699(-)
MQHHPAGRGAEGAGAAARGVLAGGGERRGGAGVQPVVLSLSRGAPGEVSRGVQGREFAGRVAQEGETERRLSQARGIGVLAERSWRHLAGGRGGGDVGGSTRWAGMCERGARWWGGASERCGGGWGDALPQQPERRGGARGNREARLPAPFKWVQTHGGHPPLRSEQNPGGSAGQVRTACASGSPREKAPRRDLAGRGEVLVRG